MSKFIDHATHGLETHDLDDPRPTSLCEAEYASADLYDDWGLNPYRAPKWMAWRPGDPVVGGVFAP